MRKICGFVNLFNSPELGPLTEKRNFGSVTFLGRYGLIDFALSNFTNSGINRVGIIVNKFPNSIRSHVQNGSAFTINTKTGYLGVLYNEQHERKDTHNDVTTIKATRTHYDIVEDSDYVVIAPAHLLMCMDFYPIIREHIASEKDVTVVYEHRFDLDKEFKGANLLSIGNKKAKFLKKNDQKEKEGFVCLDTYILSRHFFDEILEEHVNINEKYGLNDMIKFMVNKSRKEMNAHEYNGFVLPVTSLDNYIKGSFFLLSYLNRIKLIKDGWPIYTATHNTPPARYGPKANVKNSFIANGSIINGTVENSILSREVIVSQGASVKNSIVFTKTEIAKGASLNFVLTDKTAYIGEKASISGTKKEYFIIKQGAKI